jgi:hypothetical protein
MRRKPPNKDMNLTSSAWQAEALLASYVRRSADPWWSVAMRRLQPACSILGLLVALQLVAAREAQGGNRYCTCTLLHYSSGPGEQYGESPREVGAFEAVFDDVDYDGFEPSSRRFQVEEWIAVISISRAAPNPRRFTLVLEVSRDGQTPRKSDSVEAEIPFEQWIHGHWKGLTLKRFADSGERTHAFYASCQYGRPGRGGRTK